MGPLVQGPHLAGWLQVSGQHHCSDSRVPEPGELLRRGLLLSAPSQLLWLLGTVCSDWLT